MFNYYFCFYCKFIFLQDRNYRIAYIFILLKKLYNSLVKMITLCTQCNFSRCTHEFWENSLIFVIIYRLRQDVWRFIFMFMIMFTYAYDRIISGPITLWKQPITVSKCSEQRTPLKIYNYVSPLRFASRAHLSFIYDSRFVIRVVILFTISACVRTTSLI